MPSQITACPRLTPFVHRWFSSAGFDAHRDDDMSHLMWSEPDYAWLTHEIIAATECHAHGRIVSLLEGGYVLPALARSAAAHVRVLIGAD